MAAIRQLDPHVANLIAAGEVVERPASVVKELVENAIDAGATQITVEIQNGGMSLVRVTDNGGGIPALEAEVAFLRHATSKLYTARDLEAIGTLGFRGEALAAIAAVSRVELLSRTEEAPLGIALALEAGVVREREEIGCPLGTTLMIRDLFFNTPARLKFMKRDAAEGAAVFALVQRLALARPQVSLKFIRDGKQELLTPGDGQIRSALYSVLGRDLALGFTPVSGSGEETQVSGFVSMPACCRGTRGYQHFVLNGRPIKSRLLTAALEEAYKNQKMVGKFPGCVLHLDTKLSAVDVNVHPAKTEVKFLREKQVFDGVYYTVLSALGEERRHPAATLLVPPGVPPEAMPRAGGGLHQGQQQLRDSMGGGAVWRGHSSLPASLSMPRGAINEPPISQEEPQMPVSVSMPRPEEKLSPVAPPEPVLRIAPAPEPEPEQLTLVTHPPASAPAMEPVAAEEPPAQGQDWRVVGELLQTYIVVEQGETVYLIDKHAAHERMNFDRMKAGTYEPMAQSLLEPLVLTLPPEEGAALLAQLPLLEEFGFLAEEFGGGALVIRQIPFDVAPGEVENTLAALARGLLTGAQSNPAAARDHLLHTMACKAAIKGGQKNAPEELLVVAKAVLDGEVKYCPHGRPVAVTLTRAQLERQFGRA